MSSYLTQLPNRKADQLAVMALHFCREHTPELTARQMAEDTAHIVLLEAERDAQREVLQALAAAVKSNMDAGQAGSLELAAYEDYQNFINKYPQPTQA